MTDSERLYSYACSLAFAAFGFAVAIASQPLWTRPAPSGQVPGYMRTHGLDARGPFWFTVTLVVLPLIVAFATRRLSAILSESDAQPWARMTCWAACAASIWLAVISPDVAYVIAPVVLFVPLAFILRRFDARFSSDDVVLLPAFIVTFFALLDLTDADGRLLLIASAFVLFAMRLALSRKTNAFAFTPLGIIPEATLLFGHRAWLNVLALAIVFVTPWIGRGSKKVLTFVAYPAFVYFLPLACSLWASEGVLRVSFFEAGHSVLRASDMMHGARPYRETVPMHGFIEDGALDYVLMRFGARTAGSVMKGHELASQLNAPAMYAVTTAAAASPAAGLLAVLFANGGSSLRCAFALFAVALMVAAYRRESFVLLRRAAVLTVVACLTSLDFGAYAVLALIVTAILMTPRRSAFKAIGAGIAIAAAPVVLLFAIFGILTAAISRTLALGSLAPGSSSGFFMAPKLLHDLRYFPDVLYAFLQRPSMAIGVWIAAVLILAIGLAMNVPRNYAPLVILAAFVAATGLSYAERRHLYPIENGGYPMVFAATALLLRDRRQAARVCGIVAAAILFVAAGITPNIAVMSSVRRQRGTTDTNVTEVREIHRARGILMDKPDAEYLTTLNNYFSQNLGPTETFFDFTNHGLIYYLLDRRCPVPMNEVAAYETASGQREVIRCLEQQREVTYALIPASYDRYEMDAVPNRERAPLVWAYLQEHFQPAFEQGAVVVWKRIE
ncbi:MAG TPA: hypothetical protein VGJ81_18910 [Thermoanaerobaculia bacterium]